MAGSFVLQRGFPLPHLCSKTTSLEGPALRQFLGADHPAATKRPKIPSRDHHDRHYTGRPPRHPGRPPGHRPENTDHQKTSQSQALRPGRGHQETARAASRNHDYASPLGTGDLWRPLARGTSDIVSSKYCCD